MSTTTRRVRRHRRPTVIGAAVAVALSATQALSAPSHVALSPASGALGLVTVEDRAQLAVATRALRAAGLTVQPLRRLPVLLVEGAPGLVQRSLATTGVGRYYPDERLELFAADSNATIGADQLQAMGLTGKGVQVAVVDSGIDATHPDLASRVTHNVVIASAKRHEEVSPLESLPDPLIVTEDLGPGSNTDTGNGHGTLVAGVVAGDGTSGKDLVGVAPGAELIGYAAGVLGLANAVTAFDHVLDHPEWGIDVVNASFGSNKFSVFDPQQPLNVASKALSDAGIAVVFAAANAGAGGLEMTMSQFAAAPWVIGAAASTISGERADLSSNGLSLDNAGVAPLRNGHVSFAGDRLGIYHPSVAAPGQGITTTCTQTGQYANQPLSCPLDGFSPGNVAGTSFATPHIAGVLALLEQARPGLTTAQLKQVLEATAKPTRTPEPAWKVGYGLVDAPAALSLLKKKGFAAALKKAHRDASARLLGQRVWDVDVSDLWSFTAPVVSTAETGSRTFSLAVPAGTDALKLGITSYDVATLTGTPGWTITVTDAVGREVGRTAEIGRTFAGPIGSVLLDLRGKTPAFGTWTLTAAPTIGLNDEPEGSTFEVVVHAARLAAR